MSIIQMLKEGNNKLEKEYQKDLKAKVHSSLLLRHISKTPYTFSYGLIDEDLTYKVTEKVIVELVNTLSLKELNTLIIGLIYFSEYSLVSIIGSRLQIPSILYLSTSTDNTETTTEIRVGDRRDKKNLFKNELQKILMMETNNLGEKEMFRGFPSTQHYLEDYSNVFSTLLEIERKTVNDFTLTRSGRGTILNKGYFNGLDLGLDSLVEKNLFNNILDKELKRLKVNLTSDFIDLTKKNIDIMYSKSLYISSIVKDLNTIRDIFKKDKVVTFKLSDFYRESVEEVLGVLNEYLTTLGRIKSDKINVSCKYCYSKEQAKDLIYILSNVTFY